MYENILALLSATVLYVIRSTGCPVKFQIRHSALVQSSEKLSEVGFRSFGTFFSTYSKLASTPCMYVCMYFLLGIKSSAFLASNHKVYSYFSVK